MTEQQKEIIIRLCDCNMSPMAVARSMVYSRGNIIYHINRIKEKTGLNPMVFNDLIVLREIVSEEHNGECIEMVRTNADRIRSMTDEQLADLITNIHTEWIDEYEYIYFIGRKQLEEYTDILEWLKSEVGCE